MLRLVKRTLSRRDHLLYAFHPSSAFHRKSRKLVLAERSSLREFYSLFYEDLHRHAGNYYHPGTNTTLSYPLPGVGHPYRDSPAAFELSPTFQEIHSKGIGSYFELFQ